MKKAALFKTASSILRLKRLSRDVFVSLHKRITIVFSKDLENLLIQKGFYRLGYGFLKNLELGC